MDMNLNFGFRVVDPPTNLKRGRQFTNHFLTKMMRKATAVPVMTAATTAISIIVPDP